MARIIICIANFRHACTVGTTLGFPMLLHRWELHESLLKAKTRRLSHHLEEQGVMTSAYASKWFLQCFQDRVCVYIYI